MGFSHSRSSSSSASKVSQVGGFTARLLGFTGTLALTLVCIANPSQDSAELTMKAPVLETEKTVERALSRGKIKAGGAAGVSVGPNSLVTVAPSVEVFVMDKFTVGLNGDLHFWNGRLSHRTIRPSMSYYLLTGEEFAIFFRQEVAFSKTFFEDGLEVTNEIQGRSSIGLDWFVGKNVALTPVLGLRYAEREKVSGFGGLNLSVFF